MKVSHIFFKELETSMNVHLIKVSITGDEYSEDDCNDSHYSFLAPSPPPKTLKLIEPASKKNLIFATDTASQHSAKPILQSK